MIDWATQGVVALEKNSFPRMCAFHGEVGFLVLQRTDKLVSHRKISNSFSQ